MTGESKGGGPETHHLRWCGPPKEARGLLTPLGVRAEAERLKLTGVMSDFAFKLYPKTNQGGGRRRPSQAPPIFTYS